VVAAGAVGLRASRRNDGQSNDEQESSA
jgi:hypothetical protein